MTKLIFVALISICAATLKAQVTFVKGYIVNDKGDTLKGEVKINPKKEQDNHNKVFFKDDKGIQKNYKPNKVKAYGYENNHYITMDMGGEDKYYKAIARGEISLYKMIFEEIKMNESSFEAEYFLQKNGDKKMTDVKPNKFKKQLGEMISGAAGYVSDYEDSKTLDEAKAAEIINKYNTREK